MSSQLIMQTPQLENPCSILRNNSFHHLLARLTPPQPGEPRGTARLKSFSSPWESPAPSLSGSLRASLRGALHGTFVDLGKLGAGRGDVNRSTL